MKFRVGSWPKYDEVEIEPGEQLCFDELPGRPNISFEDDGRMTIRTDGAMVVTLGASNSITIGARK